MPSKIKLLSLNIGNPSLERAKRQCEWLINRPEDVFVLTETKNSKGCAYIEEFFLQYGYDLFSLESLVNYSVNFPKSQTGDLGVMIISKYPIKVMINLFAQDSIYFSRQTEILIAVEDTVLSIVGLYVPSRDRRTEKIERKRKFINNCEKFFGETKNVKRIIMGDLNILDRDHIPHYKTFYEWEYDFYDALLRNGYVDVYKYCNPNIQDYSWVGRTNDGYRYDYCFVSDDLKSGLVNCEFLHETRSSKLTDHSAIMMEICL